MDKGGDHQPKGDAHLVDKDTQMTDERVGSGRRSLADNHPEEDIGDQKA